MASGSSTRAPSGKAVVGLTAVAFVLIQIATDMLYWFVDPRVA